MKKQNNMKLKLPTSEEDAIEFIKKQSGNIPLNIALNQKDPSGMTLLMWAMIRNHQKIAKWVIENGIDVNAQDDNGITALNYASYKNNVEMVKLLLESKADPNLGNIMGMTPLMTAVLKGNIEVVIYLIPETDISIKDDRGNTALMISDMTSYVAIGILLREAEEQNNIEGKDEI